MRPACNLFKFRVSQSIYFWNSLHPSATSLCTSYLYCSLWSWFIRWLKFDRRPHVMQACVMDFHIGKSLQPHRVHVLTAFRVPMCCVCGWWKLIPRWALERQCVHLVFLFGGRNWLKRFRTCHTAFTHMYELWLKLIADRKSSIASRSHTTGTGWFRKSHGGTKAFRPPYNPLNSKHIALSVDVELTASILVRQLRRRISFIHHTRNVPLPSTTHKPLLRSNFWRQTQMSTVRMCHPSNDN